ncbi:MAG: hypothetical protein DMG05_27095 [Acidobacteria bacterium]|nr:MAG: hypothetical protein DMG05_27095 [Acidobacteriota bacterium]
MKLRTVFLNYAVALACALGFTPSGTPARAHGGPRLGPQSRLSVGVLIDTSAHQKNVINFEREVVNLVSDAFAQRPAETFVIRYADEVELLQDWSPLALGLRTVSSRIEVDVSSEKNQRTLLYEALNAGLLKIEGNGANSKVLLIIGEGNNADGAIKYWQIKKRAEATRVQCFVLLVADHNLMGGRVRHFGFYFYDLASATKGRAYDIERSRKNLDKAIQDVLKRIH